MFYHSLSVKQMIKMTIQILVVFAVSIILISCEPVYQKDLMEQYKTEILNTETAFAKMAKDQGVQKAFLKYASNEAVLKRGNKLIKGRQAIKEYFDNQTLKDVKLEWEPDFIDVSVAGDLGYTYGEYNFKATDSTGKIIKDKGMFHTVWKKEGDGKWRYVWD